MENTCIAFQHTALKNAYRAILEQMLRSHNVKSLSCCSDTERFFDRIDVLPGSGLHVYTAGLSTPMDSLHFDFTCDFARCISYIEDAIYQQRHGINMEHGIIIEFEPEDQPGEKPTFWDYVGTLKQSSDEWRLAMEIGQDYFGQGKNPDEYLDEIKTEVEKRTKNNAQ